MKLHETFESILVILQISVTLQHVNILKTPANIANFFLPNTNITYQEKTLLIKGKGFLK